ncbi:MAG: dTDP-4-dehydrorhamnose reductase [bacterium]
MKILLTGANGMLGKDLTQVLIENDIEPILTDVKDMDITDLNSVNETISAKKPDYVIHCAAYTNVDAAEDDKYTAYLINATGAEYIALATAKENIPLIYISTDYVFDGEKGSSYEITDKTNPINVYGASKLAGEVVVQQHNPQSYIARTSWLYGQYGKNFVDTMISLSQKNSELKVVADQIGCPTWTVALSNALLDLIFYKKRYGVYHMCGTGYTSWHGFAEKIFELSDIDINVIPVTTDEFPRAAKRPKFSAMNNNGLLDNWEKSLEEYLEIKKSL